MLPKIDELIDKVKNDRTRTAVLLGSGDSINRITQQEWAAISKLHTWTTNNWVYHPWFVPDFYMIESKWYGYDILRRHFRQKWNQYKNTTEFIFAYGKRIKMRGGRNPYLRDIVPDDGMRYEYTCIPRDSKRTHKKFNADYTVLPHGLTKSYDMSMTLMFEILHKVGYEQIIIFGIDLVNSKYFWGSGHPKFGEVHHLWNKAHEHNDPNKPHATHRIKDFIVDAQHRWFEADNKSLYVGHLDTGLYPDIPYKDITECVSGLKTPTKTQTN